MQPGDFGGRTDEDAQEAVKFAEACGVRVFWVEGLREGAIYLMNGSVVLLDLTLPGRLVHRALDAALCRIPVE
jgi:hypothetical protein